MKGSPSPSGAWIVPLVTLLTATMACSSTSERACLVHADCASGICGADGQCAAKDAGTADGAEDVRARFLDAGQPKDVAAAADSGTAADDQATNGGDPGVCKPDHDGKIERHEAPYGAGLSATYRIAANATVASAGVQQNDGSRVWDFAGAFAGDHDAKVQTLAVAGTWYESWFKGATYASRLVEGEPLLGVFEVSQDALLLRGVVSETGGLLATRLVYDPPVEVLAFPLTKGQTWQRKSSISGLSNGVIAVATETYSSTVDAHGVAKTPFGNFPVLRVSIVLDRQVGLATTRLRSQLFATECFGTVASLRAHAGESEVDFKNAAELRRLTP